jgi:hypothetical protein
MEARYEQVTNRLSHRTRESIKHLIETSPTYDRRWVRGSQLHVYFRKAFHDIDIKGTGQARITKPTLDVADIELRSKVVWREVFLEFLTFIEPLADNAKLTIYFETLTDDRLTGILLKRGYVIANLEQKVFDYHFVRVMDET